MTSPCPLNIPCLSDYERNIRICVYQKGNICNYRFSNSYVTRLSWLQSITRKTKPIVTACKINDVPLESTCCERDIGVRVCSDLIWREQVLEQTARANKLLGYVRRNTGRIKSVSIRRSMYVSMVRPHIGYATQVWAPQSIDLMLKL